MGKIISRYDLNFKKKEVGRTAQASVKIAHDLAVEGLISKNDALLMVEPDQLDQLLHRQIDPSVKLDVVATGLPASPGATL